MDLITGMVQQNANISQEQAHKAIEAVLAYVVSECGDYGKAINTAIVNSNGSSMGGFDGSSILDSYREKHGSLIEKLQNGVPK